MESSLPHNPLFKQKLLLASQSKSRKNIMNNAGIGFESISPNFDEDKYKSIYRNAQAQGAASKQVRQKETTVALKLAEGKALSVSSLQEHSSKLVVASDQSKSQDGTPIDKPADLEDAMKQLLMMNGKAHVLHSSTCVAKNGKIIWSCSRDNIMTVKKFSTHELESYLKALDPEVVMQSGVYQVESLGIGLFAQIEGEHFSIMGLDLLPLISFLRSMEQQDV